MNAVNPPLPNLVISGVAKAGTTSVFTYLAQHPEVCGSSIKEAQYFSAYRYGGTLQPINSYRELFSSWQDEKYVLEATPGYFEGGRKLATKMKETLGEDTRVLIILREPVDRLLSFFKYKKSALQLNKNLTLKDYISQCQRMTLAERETQENDLYWGLDGGMYSNYLQAWLEVFGDSLKIMFFDDLRASRIEFMKELCQWLGIDPSIYDRMILEIENKSQNYKSKKLQAVALTINAKMETILRRHPVAKHRLRQLYYSLNKSTQEESYLQETIEYLQDFYKPYNGDLVKILQAREPIELPIWLAEANQKLAADPTIYP